VKRSAAALVAVLCASCGARLITLPAGPGAPASDAAAVIDQAIAACRAVDTITLEMSVRGSAAGRRLRGRLTAGLARPSSARLEAVASFGPPVFVFVTADGDASLLLPRDRRVLEHGTPADVLEAVSGVPLDAAGLRMLVTGCANAPGASGTRSVGDAWRVAPDGDDRVYFRRVDASWRLVATTHRSTSLTARRGEQPGWLAEYSMFEDNLPRRVRLVSQPAGRFDLQLDLSQVETNVPLGAGVFRLQQTAPAAPMTLDELRRSGPLGAR